MFQPSNFGRLCFVLICLCAGSVAWAAHPYHVSLTELEWNGERESLEVAMWVWPADLEKGLARHLNRSVDLDKEEQLDDKLNAYLATRFSVKNKDGESLKWRWVGHEKNLKQAWLYLEVKGVSEGETIEISNRIFNDLNEDQLNQLNIKIGSKEKRHALTQDEPKLAVEIVERKNGWN